MVTDLQFYNAVKSYNYRQNLIYGINDLEQKIIDYMNDKNLKMAVIPGYSIDISNHKIIVKEQPIPDLNQLCLEFIEVNI